MKGRSSSTPSSRELANPTAQIGTSAGGWSAWSVDVAAVLNPVDHGLSVTARGQASSSRCRLSRSTR